MFNFFAVQDQTSQVDVLLGDADGVFESVKVGIYLYGIVWNDLHYFFWFLENFPARKPIS